MGSDEHGPAYPEHVPENVVEFHRRISAYHERYRCGVCGTNADLQWTRCNHPGCPDGRDQEKNRPKVNGHPYEPTDSSPTWPVALVGWACALALILYIIWPH